MALISKSFGIMVCRPVFGKKIGTIWFVLVYHIGLIFAGIILIVLYPSGHHYGASPAIFACIGVLANWLVKIENYGTNINCKRILLFNGLFCFI